MKILLVLGSPNAADGKLSPMALGRLNECLNLYRGSEYKIALTGGFGAHFNVSPQAHAVYLKEFLIKEGVKEADILGLIESAHSVEDATLSRWLITAYCPDEVVVITSDYHYARAKLIFETVYAPFRAIRFQLASSEGIDATIVSPLVAHERVALQDLLDNGVRF